MLPTIYAGSLDPKRPDPQHALPPIHLLLFKDVQNAAEVKQQIIKSATAGDDDVPECVMLNAASILDLFQIQVACTKALLAQHQSSMKTKTLYSEILFNLSPNNNISESLKWFGLGSGVKAVLVGFVGKEPPPEDAVRRVKDLIKGDLVPLETLPSLRDMKLIKKVG
ncbi:hypothetical protein HK101_009066 [Irineochytrium annulatum]|nr:hypothetical protein HK101_009066 [Irineochytrium annulatum]